MATKSTGDLELWLPAMTDVLDDTIETHLVENFNKIDEGHTTHKDESALKHIKESGSNANGNYIKFDDGTMICYISKTIESLAMTTSLASTGWFQSADQSWTYPAIFTSSPVFYPSNNTGGGGRYMAISRGVSATLGGFVLLSSTSTTPSVGVHLLAIGRWK